VPLTLPLQSFLQDMRRETTAELSRRMNHLAGAGHEAVGNFVRNRWLCNIHEAFRAGFAPVGLSGAYRKSSTSPYSRWRYGDALLIFPNLDYDSNRRPCPTTALPYRTSGAVTGVQVPGLKLKYHVDRVIVVGIDVAQIWAPHKFNAPPTFVGIREILIGEPAKFDSKFRVVEWKKGAGVLHSDCRTAGLETPAARQKRHVSLPVQISARN
jgi:hypothetical protein